MPDLFITPTRWDLLDAVEGGAVYRERPPSGQDVWDLGPGCSPRLRKVDGRVRELRQADLIRLEEPGAHHWVEPRLHELTAAGCEALAEHTCTVCRGYTSKAPTCGTCKGRCDD